MTRFHKIALRFGGIALIALSAGACSPTTAIRGSMPDSSDIALVIPGVHGQDDVHSILGAPSSVGTFDDRTWYYIGRRVEQYAFFDRDTVAQQVVIVHFGVNDRVDSVRILGLEDGRDIAMVERETPSAGRKLKFWEQILGNVGRFGNDAPSGP